MDWLYIVDYSEFICLVKIKLVGVGGNRIIL